MDKKLGQKTYTPGYSESFRVADDNGRLIVNEQAAIQGMKSSWKPVLIEETIRKEDLREIIVDGMKDVAEINIPKVKNPLKGFSGKAEAEKIKNTNKKALEELRSMMK